MLSVLQESPVVDRPNSVAAKPIVPRPKKHRLAANFSVNVSDMQWMERRLGHKGNTHSFWWWLDVNRWCRGTVHLWTSYSSHQGRLLQLLPVHCKCNYQLISELNLNFLPAVFRSNMNYCIYCIMICDMWYVILLTAVKYKTAFIRPSVILCSLWNYVPLLNFCCYLKDPLIKSTGLE
jgi:hypothetical protein